MCDIFTQLEYKFQSLVEKTENYLKPIIEFIDSYFR